MPLFNISQFQKLSLEQCVILPWLSDGNGAVRASGESTAQGERVAIYQAILQSQFVLLWNVTVRVLSDYIR